MVEFLILAALAGIALTGLFAVVRLATWLILAPFRILTRPMLPAHQPAWHTGWRDDDDIKIRIKITFPIPGGDPEVVPQPRQEPVRLGLGADERAAQPRPDERSRFVVEQLLDGLQARNGAARRELRRR